MPTKVSLDALSIAEQIGNVSSSLQGNVSSFSEMSGVETGMDMDEEIAQHWREIAEKEKIFRPKRCYLSCIIYSFPNIKMYKNNWVDYVQL